MLISILFFTLIFVVYFTFYNGGFLRPTSFLPLYFAFTLTIGILGFNVYDFAYGMPFKLGDSLGIEAFETAALIIFISIIGYSIGCSVMHRKGIRVNLSVRKIKKKDRSLFVKIFYISFPAYLLLTSYGIPELISRQNYIPDNIQAFKFMGLLMMLLLVINLREITQSKILISLTYAVYTVILFGYATRWLALLPLANLLSLMLYDRTKPLGLFTILTSILLCFLANVVVIQIRSIGVHGIVPYFNHLYSNGIEFELLVIALNYITAFSYSLTAYLSTTISYSAEYFWISINPMLGSMAGWPEIADELRVNKFVPYNAISELAAMGYGVLFAYFFIAGATLKVIENKFLTINIFCTIFVFVTVGLLATQLFQYNLRSATRGIYYLLLFYLAITAYQKTRFILPRRPI